MSKSKPVILISPLDWGLGHATRCIPVIHSCLRFGEVVIAADGAPLRLLQEAFPGLECIPLGGHEVRYPGSEGNMLLSMIRQAPALLASFRAEHKQLERLLQRRHFDLIISDNRYGLYHPEVPSVLITHQLTIKVPMLPMLDWASHKLVRNSVRRFTECWVPDFSGEDNLSGALSGKFAHTADTHFIGPLSRFSAPAAQIDSSWAPLFKGGPFDLLMVVSGPEPNAGELREELTKQAIALDKRSLLISGLPSEGYALKEQGKLTTVSHVPPAVMQRLMSEAQVLVMRSGYTSLMDLAALGRGALLIPTPGQTEQEYLGERMAEKGWHLNVRQSELDLKKQIPRLGSVENPKRTGNNDLLETRLVGLLAKS